MVLEINTEERIDPKSTVGAVILAVRDLEETTAFYRNVIGLDLQGEQSGRVELGVDNNPLVILEHRPDGRQFPLSPGLFHMAILVPSRQDLGHWLEHCTRQGHRLSGVGDHIVSEALYLSDPEGNGIEIYRDRPLQEWQYADGELVMDTLAVDLHSLLEEAYDKPFRGMPEGTKMGHVHLQVNDLQQARRFYRDVVGFDVMTGMPSASFLSAGGYHHHLGMNTWRSRGVEARPEDALGLIAYQVVLPDEEALKTHLSAMENRGAEIETQNGTAYLIDPSGNKILFVSA